MSEALHQHLQTLQHYLEQISEQEHDLHVSLEAIDELNKTGKGTEMIVPLAQGVFVKATLRDTNKFLVGVGSQVVSAKNSSEAKEVLLERLEDLKGVKEQLSAQFSEAYQQIIEQQLKKDVEEA